VDDIVYFVWVHSCLSVCGFIPI